MAASGPATWESVWSGADKEAGTERNKGKKERENAGEEARGGRMEGIGQELSTVAVGGPLQENRQWPEGQQIDDDWWSLSAHWACL